MSGGASFGVLPPLAGDGTIRVRLFRGNAIVQGEPDPGSTIDITFALPAAPPTGAGEYTLFSADGGRRRLPRSDDPADAPARTAEPRSRRYVGGCAADGRAHLPTRRRSLRPGWRILDGQRGGPRRRAGDRQRVQARRAVALLHRRDRDDGRELSCGRWANQRPMDRCFGLRPPRLLHVHRDAWAQRSAPGHMHRSGNRRAPSARARARTCRQRPSSNT